MALNPFQYFREKISDDKYALRVQQTGRNVEEEILLNAASINAEDSEIMTIEQGDYDELWISVNIDQQPWKIMGRLYEGNTLVDDFVFPRGESNTETYIDYPALRFVTRLSGRIGIPYPASLSEAKDNAMPYNGGTSITFRVYNDSLNIATVTVKAIKVWR